MSTSSIEPEIRRPEEDVSRARAAWLIVAQCAALGLLACALMLAGRSSDALPQTRQALLLLLALLHLGIAGVPAWRRSSFAGVLGGVTLATACWLSAKVTLEIEAPGDWGFLVTFIPLAAPIALAVAVVLVVWGLAVRGGLADSSRLGLAAMLGGLLLASISIGLYRLVNFSPAFKSLYMIESYQLTALLSSLTLYSLALWLGSVGLRPVGGRRLQPLGMALVLIGFVAYWHIRINS